MAKDNSIVPFPNNINRDAFGHYLAGLTDGEGSFILYIDHWKAAHGRFSLSLRLDDLQILKLTQSFWQCGRFHYHTHVKGNGKPSARFIVERCSDLINTIIPNFYPLRAKKSADFRIWKEAVFLIYHVLLKRKQGRSGLCGGGTKSKWTQAERDRFADLYTILRAQRAYQAPTLEIPIAPRNQKPPGFFDLL